MAKSGGAAQKGSHSVYQGGHFPKHPGSAAVKGPHAHTNVPSPKGALTTYKKYGF